MDIHLHSEMCDFDMVHADVVAHVKEVMEDTEVVYALSDFFKVMSDSTRMRIMAVLDSDEPCVCDLAEVLGMTKSAVSHQLKVLKDAQLVKFRREGKNILYSLADDHVRTILQMGLEHVEHV